ncbi:uncharacterized protein NPIL_466701 [Nephila pilipes]|uniref:Uncharacterized protein n=1 Tax=Nephila pilipes TaxID=299642 RepID=A0A8X6R346_NEPPI|nr:uncharacterized protein NPIL_466701 [Nephila pilipes]
MACSKKIPSLQESASAQVAINLCQDNDFKKVALRLEKPICSIFNLDGPAPPCIGDAEAFSMWMELRKYQRSLRQYQISCNTNDKEDTEQWHAAIHKQCQRLTEGLPSSLKDKVHDWMNRIALEYFSYSRRQEMLFGVSRYLLMDVLTLASWTKAGRLDEKKLAERMLKDERLTVMQRYRMACVYRLDVHMNGLWVGLDHHEKRSFLTKKRSVTSVKTTYKYHGPMTWLEFLTKYSRHVNGRGQNRRC